MKALITGVTGQDGAYLARFLLDKNYEVHGLSPRRSSENTWRLQRLNVDIPLIEGDVTDRYSLTGGYDEVYNLAAQSFVGASWDQWEVTLRTNGLGAVNVFNAYPEARIYQASTSEMYGNHAAPQYEYTPMHPRSPYGAAKLYAHEMANIYRESYDRYICCGILFNHESPLRGAEFVTQKIATAAKRRQRVTLGDLEARRDWGFAGDYVEAMWAMLQKDMADDYVIATGETHSVREFAQLAYGYVGLNWCDFVEQDEAFMRPAEINVLQGDASKAEEILDWRPRTTFKALVGMMCS